MDPQIPGFTVVRELGRGGMGVVLLARQHKHDRLVALKLLQIDEDDDDTERTFKRFRREAAILAKLSHPHVLRLLDHDLDAATPWIACEYLEDALTVDLWVRRKKPSLEATLALLGAIADALACLHAASVMHRDLKPANVLVDKTGAVRVIDMGLARDVEGKDRVTKTGDVVGTLSYMAPEQILGAKPDARADVYAFGLIAHEIVANKAVFNVRAREPIPPQRRLMTGGIPPLEPFHKHAPAALIDLVRLCQSVMPEDRPKDGAALSRALKAIAGGAASLEGLDVLPPSARPTTIDDPPTRQLPALRARGTATALAAAGAIALAAALFAVRAARAPALAPSPPPSALAELAWEAPPTLDLAGGELRLRGTTRAPARLRATVRERGTPVEIDAETAPATHHDLVVGGVMHAGASDAAIVPDPAGEVPLRPALAALCREAAGLLARIRARADATLKRDAGRADPPALDEALGASEMHAPLAALRAAAPWIRRALADPDVELAARLKLISAISDAQPLDALTPGALARGHGEIHALLPPELALETAPGPGWYGRFNDAIMAIQKAPATTLGTLDVRGHPFVAQLTEAPQGRLVVVSDHSNEHQLMIGYNPDHPASALFEAPKAKDEPDTGWITLELPARVADEDLRVCVTALARDPIPLPVTLEFREVVRLALDAPPPPNANTGDGIYGIWRRIPRGALKAGRVQVRQYVPRLPWWPDRRLGLWIGWQMFAVHG